MKLKDIGASLEHLISLKIFLFTVLFCNYVLTTMLYDYMYLFMDI